MFTNTHNKTLSKVVEDLPCDLYEILEMDYAYDLMEWESSKSMTLKPVLVFVDDCDRPVTIISRDLALQLPCDTLGKAVERVFDG